MQLCSTKNPSLRSDFKTATLQGLAPDGGLFIPVSLPRFSEAFFEELPALSFSEIAYRISCELVADEIPPETLKTICDESFNFPVPLISLDATTSVLELFHGPTLAFKDFGARCMARVMAYFVKNINRELVVLVATSGDTGSAVAHGFFGVPGISVFVLYPSGKVSPLQEKMLTTMGGNITAVEVEGTFDDCQRLVKSAFMDDELRKRFFLTSANSINSARLIPQTFYYFYAVSRLPHRRRDAPLVISVPSGNFGNVTAGLYAKQMGLPVNRFIAPTNANDVVPHYYKTGEFTPKPSRHTLTNAMDVGDPSNFARIQALYDSREKLSRDFWTASFSDQQTTVALRTLYEKYQYVADPHGALGFGGLEAYRQTFPEARDTAGIFLETAHPAKFLHTVHAALKIEVAVPDIVQKSMTKQKQAIPVGPDFAAFKKLLFR